MAPDQAFQNWQLCGTLPGWGLVPVREDLLISEKASQSWTMHNIFQTTVCTLGMPPTC